MKPGRGRRLALTAIAAVLELSGVSASAEELTSANLVDLSAGYRTTRLEGTGVINEKEQRIGTIIDFVVVRDLPPAAIVDVAGFLGIRDHLVAVPFKSLKLDDSSGKIVLPGASREALRKLPVFLYNR